MLDLINNASTGMETVYHCLLTLHLQMRMRKKKNDTFHTCAGRLYLALGACFYHPEGFISKHPAVIFTMHHVFMSGVANCTSFLPARKLNSVSLT